MRPVELLVIGGSAGSLQVILSVLAAMKAGYSIPVLIVLHRNGGFESMLEDLFATRANLPIKEVEEKDAIQRGTVYLCPPDYHVLVEQDHTFSLDYSERVNYSRPSIDVTFRSAADVYGEGLVCVLLSGGNADGTEGLLYVRENGGYAIAEDPQTAEVPYMPQQAVSRMAVDAVIPTTDLPAFIEELSRRGTPDR